jgi:hypothetical protein
MQKRLDWHSIMSRFAERTNKFHICDDSHQWTQFGYICVFSKHTIRTLDRTLSDLKEAMNSVRQSDMADRKFLYWFQLFQRALKIFREFLLTCLKVNQLGIWEFSLWNHVPAVSHVSKCWPTRGGYNTVIGASNANGLTFCMHLPRSDCYPGFRWFTRLFLVGPGRDASWRSGL